MGEITKTTDNITQLSYTGRDGKTIIMVLDSKSVLVYLGGDGTVLSEENYKRIDNNETNEQRIAWVDDKGLLETSNEFTHLFSEEVREQILSDLQIHYGTLTKEVHNKMARREYPFELKHNLDKALRLKQAQLTVERGNPITLQELYKDMAEFMGVSENTVALIKSNNYNPSLVVALAMAEYLGTSVDDLFSIERKEV